MPIYEYRCGHCGRVVEVMQHTHEERTIDCQACGNRKMERMISAANVMRTSCGPSGGTCCGREERCEAPPCAGDCQCHGG
jgi:putative FmdB family regulatory protein